MITIKQLIKQSVKELGLTAEDPDTNINSPECLLLDSLIRRVVSRLNTSRLYGRRKERVTLSNNTFDLDGLTYLCLGIETVATVGGATPDFFVDGHLLKVDGVASSLTVDVVYIGCAKVPASQEEDLKLPTFVTESLLVAGVCLEYARAKGLEYSIGYYEEAYKEGLADAFLERRNVVIKRRRFL